MKYICLKNIMKEKWWDLRGVLRTDVLRGEVWKEDVGVELL